MIKEHFGRIRESLGLSIDETIDWCTDPSHLDMVDRLDAVERDDFFMAYGYLRGIADDRNVTLSTLILLEVLNRD